MAGGTIVKTDRYLAVMYDYLHKLLYRYHVLQADETPVEVSKDGRAAGAKSFMWIYRTGKSYAEAIILYEYQKDRKDTCAYFLKTAKSLWTIMQQNPRCAAFALGNTTGG